MISFYIGDKGLKIAVETVVNATSIPGLPTIRYVVSVYL